MSASRAFACLLLAGVVWGFTTPQTGFVSYGGDSWLATDATVENIRHVTSPEPYTYLPISALPTNWDWKRANNSPINNLCTRVMTQMQPKQCGSCWAMAASGAMSDRFQVAVWQASKGKTKANPYNLAPQVLLDCGMETTKTGLVAGSCYGGSALLAYKWMFEYGITDESCAPYIGSSPSWWAEIPCHTRMCHKCDRFGACEVLKNPPKYRAEEYGAITPMLAKKAGTTMVHMMMAEIYARGPITCSIYAHAPSFENYTSGIIQDPKKWPGTTHDIVLTGFGTSAGGVKYWEGRNSYGMWWGEAGLFLIERGTDTLNIETQCAWGKPKGLGPSRS